MDFTQRPPRSPFDELEGFPWLPRLLDKARATVAGTLGDYYAFPTPGDRRFLWYFGIRAQEIERMVRQGAEDAAIAAYVKRTTRRSPAALEAFRRDMYRPTRHPILGLLFAMLVRRVKARILAERPDADVRAVDTLAKALAFEEGHPVPEGRP